MRGNNNFLEKLELTTPWVFAEKSKELKELNLDNGEYNPVETYRKDS